MAPIAAVLTKETSEAPSEVLCVDDHPTALALVEETLRDSYTVVTATSGTEALERIVERHQSGGFAVIVSDMRMPGMNGAELLARVRWLAPETVRILLTGYADVSSAAAAVNTGEIFRFLTKPCDRESFTTAIREAVEQHKVLVARRALLDKTLHGAVTALTETLALAAPEAFGRGRRIARRATELGRRIGLENTWEVETAAQLSQVGWVALPEATANRVARGMPLTAQDEQELRRLPLVAERLLEPIPRLEHLREVLVLQAGNKPLDGETSETAATAACLRLATDLDLLESRGLTPPEMLDILRKQDRRYVPGAVDALAKLLGLEQEAWDHVRVPIAELREGMILAEDVRTIDGVLLIARGHVVTQALLRRLQALREGSIRGDLAVQVPSGS